MAKQSAYLQRREAELDATFNAGAAMAMQLAGELNHAAQCVAEGYVTWADIRQMLKEYGVETVLE